MCFFRWGKLTKKVLLMTEKLAKAHIVVNKRTGSRAIIGQLPGRKPEIPPGHKIVHTAIAEGESPEEIRAKQLAFLKSVRERKKQRGDAENEGGDTDFILRIPDPKSYLIDLSGIPESGRRGDTERLPRVKTDESLAQVLALRSARTPLLLELTTSGSVFATGLNPNDPLFSHPRDRRGIRGNKPLSSVTSSANIGHTANTGAWVPPKALRSKASSTRKGPRPIKLIGRDSITKEFEAQPSYTGGVLSRTQLLSR